ncbi:MAG: response regulator transcription factor [Actinomycetota bacterium]
MASASPDFLVVWPDPPAADLARTLDLAGYRWKAVASPEEALEHEPAGGWAGAVVTCDQNPEGAWAFCRVLRRRDAMPAPILLLISGAELGQLEMRDDSFDDFCLTPFHPRELEARLRHLTYSEGVVMRAELIEYGGLVLNLETYQATFEGNSLDLTFMEYELLKFLAQNPGKVFTREMLLSRVWGYEYYGGARTVDVHIRRLRAKLGEEHANLIQTVRSVGYRFGQSRWNG